MRSQHAVLIWGIGGFAPTSKIRLGSTQTLLAKMVTQFAIPEEQMIFYFPSLMLFSISLPMYLIRNYFSPHVIGTFHMSGLL